MCAEYMYQWGGYVVCVGAEPRLPNTSADVCRGNRFHAHEYRFLIIGGSECFCYIPILLWAE